MAERAPFERIIITVGCADLAPAWTAQLAPNGMLLVPIQHGIGHPRVVIHVDGDRIVGRFVGHSGFVHIQGAQASKFNWQQQALHPDETTVQPLPDDIVEIFTPLNPAAPQRTAAHRDFNLYLASRDWRACPGPGITTGSSTAALEANQIAFAGPDADELAHALLSAIRDWIHLGCPTLLDYEIMFTPISEAPPPPPTVEGPWTIRRANYDEHLTLHRRST